MPEGDLDLLASDRLAPWLDARRVPGAGEPIRNAERLGGGSTNAIFRFDRGGVSLVLRRPPRHPRADSDKTIVREARVLRALRDTGVPHPRLLACCEEPSVIGGCFTVMEPIDGWNPGGKLPEPFASDPAARRQMGFELLDGIARLAQVDYRAVGLADFGRPDGFLERQVARWRSHLEGYRQLPGYPGRALPGFDEVARWLTSHIPRDYRPGILHGDYQFANVMFAHDRPELLAIIDWELSTIGDPMLDLGWILCSWSDPGEPRLQTTYVEPWSDFPARAELIDRYLSATGRDPQAVRYFRVLACYKLGILLEGHHARGVAGLGDAELGGIMANLSGWLFEQAGDLIRGRL